MSLWNSLTAIRLPRMVSRMLLIVVWSDTLPKIQTMATPLTSEIAVIAQIGAKDRNGQQTRSNTGVSRRLMRSTTVTTMFQIF